MSQPTLNSAQDVITLLTQQHQQIKSLFAQVQASTGEAREQSFFELRKLLAVHEAAEEQVVHPKAKSVIPGGEGIVAERLSEEQQAKEALAELEDLDPESAEFLSKLRTLEKDVIEHAESEERQEFAALGDALDEDQLRSMAKMVAAAEKIAPTRPHPEVKGRAANLIGGPFASMMDRVRDAV